MQHPEVSIEECAALLRGHAAFLDMLARLYYKPLSEEELATIAALDEGAFALDNPAIEEGLAQMLAYVRRGSSTLRQDVNVDYTAAFYGISAYEGQVANPCESVFRSEEGILMQRETINAYRIYKSEALKKESALGVPDDHLSFELQFLSKMSERAAQALDGGELEEALRNVDVQARFLDEHILSWFDDLADIALRILETPFYRGVLKMTRGFLETEKEDLATLVEVLRGLQSPEREEGAA